MRMRSREEIKKKKKRITNIWILWEKEKKPNREHDEHIEAKEQRISINRKKENVLVVTYAFVCKPENKN